MTYFDFQSIKTRLKNRLSAKSEWADFLSFGVVDNLIDPICQELAYSMQYAEYLAYENWWSKARNKSSLLVQSAVHGYNVPRKQGAIGTLRISTSKTFDNTYDRDSNIPINKFFQFSGNNIYVVASKDYTITPTMTYLDVECKQGECKTVSFSAEGRTYEEKLIEDGNVDNDFYELYVNGNLWTRVETLFEYDGTDQVYEIETKSDLTGIILKFGNDIFGKKLETNDKVVFKYIATDGADGNIYSIGIVDVVESQAFDNDGKPVKLYVTNTSSIIGGKDYPTIDEIRTLSPRVYQTGNRASSIEDYQSMIEQFTYISKTNVWGAYEVLKDSGLDPWTFIPTEENVVHVALLDMSYDNLTDEEKERVVEDLHAKADPTDIVQFETVEKIPLIFTVKGTVKNSSYTLNQVRANIEQSLKDNYSIENINFNTNIYNSDFTRAVDEVDGVRNHTSYIQMKKEGFFLNESYVGSFKLPIYPVTNVNFVIYIMNVTDEVPVYRAFAYCDENGNIIGYNANTNGSNINLTTGIGAIVINDTLEDDYKNYKFKIVYSCANEDLELTSRYEIFCYDESHITLNYPTV